MKQIFFFFFSGAFNKAQVQNASPIIGGGAIQNMPHSGHFNTFWNIIGNALQTNRKPGLDFFSGFWNYPSIRKERSGGQFSFECYKLYPKSIMVGVYHPGYNLTVDRSGSDRIDDWLYNEGFNRPNVSPSSLYEAQKQLREEISGIKINELSKRTHPDFVYQKDDKIVSETRSWEKYNSNLRYFREKGWTMYRQLI